MFMLTHTYFLQKVLCPLDLRDIEPDIYVYNIAPDLLTLNPNISSAQTHSLDRTLAIPADYQKSLYVIFHLLVDDLSHHGHICSGYQEKFNLNSKGYSYLKGNCLINIIRDLHKIIGKEISYSDAVYQSHLIIEMIYDLVIFNHINSFKTIDVLVEAIKYTAQNTMKEFTATVNWLYGFGENEINEVMKNALFFITKESMEEIMNIRGRINLYANKFGMKSDKQIFNERLEDLFKKAISVIDDDEMFFQETMQIIKNYNKFPLIR